GSNSPTALMREEGALRRMFQKIEGKAAEDHFTQPSVPICASNDEICAIFPEFTPGLLALGEMENAWRRHNTMMTEPGNYVIESAMSRIALSFVFNDFDNNDIFYLAEQRQRIIHRPPRFPRIFPGH